MITFVIVDDEPVIVRSVAAEIEAMYSDFAVVGKAYDGEEALALIMDCNPDILIVDIRMPVMDGLELIERLKTRKRRPATIILSGYQDFQYARKGLQLGAHDYLLKPINPIEFKETLTKLRDDIRRRKEQEQEQRLRELLFESAAIPDHELTAFTRFRSYQCIFLCMGTYSRSGFHDHPSFYDSNFQAAVLKEDARKVCRRGESIWVVDGELINEKIILIANQAEEEQDDLAALIHGNLQAKLSLPLTMVRTASFHDIREARERVRRVKTTIPLVVIPGAHICVHESDIRTTDEPPEWMNAEMEDHWRIVIRKGDKDSVLHLLREFMHRCDQSQCPQYILEKWISQILQWFEQERKIPGRVGLAVLEAEAEEIMTNATGYHSIHQGLVMLIERLFEQLHEKDDKRSDIDELMMQIENYLYDHCDQNISLQQVSRKFGISASHFSTMFKKYKQVPPLRFVTMARIEKAKVLLKEAPDLLIKDIAEAVGYDDALYFSRLFKYMTGESPREYRLKHGLQA